MSQRNLEMIRRIFDQAPHDPEVFFSSLDDEVEWDAATIDLAYVGASYWRGPTAVREFFAYGSAHSTNDASSSSRQSTWEIRLWLTSTNGGAARAAARRSKQTTGRCGPSAMGRSYA